MKEYVNNSIPFYQLVGGQYGRKIAYTDVQSITPENVEKVVADGLAVHNANKPAIRYLWNYYKGDQPVHYRTKDVHDDIINRVCENHCYEIVQFKTGQTYGEPVQFVSRRDNDIVNAAVDRLNDYMTDVDKQSKDVKSGNWQSATGTSFKAVQRKNGDIPFRIIAPTPLNTFVIYSRETEEAMLSVQELKDENGEDYLLCFSENMQFTIKDGKLTDKRLHAFGGIPVIEYPNNWERISDIELVIDLLDTINNYQSNRIDGVEQFVQSWIKFVNVDVDEKTLQDMRKLKAFIVKSNNGGDTHADVDIMTQELNQSETQVAKDDLWDNILEISGMPSRHNGASGGDTMGAVALREGWSEAKMYTQVKDPIVKAAEKQLGKIVLNVLRVSGEDLKISVKDFDVQINHAPTDNLYTKSQALLELLNAGVNPLVAIRTCGLWGDAEKTFTLSKPYLDVKYKTVEMVKEEGQAQGNIQTEQTTQTAKTSDFNNTTGKRETEL